MNIATLAAAIRTVAAQPSSRSSGGLTRAPNTFGSLVRSTTSTISGGASTPFTTADQKSILTVVMQIIFWPLTCDNQPY
jgi:hypothetical protein